MLAGKLHFGYDDVKQMIRTTCTPQYFIRELYFPCTLHIIYIFHLKWTLIKQDSPVPIAKKMICVARDCPELRNWGIVQHLCGWDLLYTHGLWYILYIFFLFKLNFNKTGFPSSNTSYKNRHICETLARTLRTIPQFLSSFWINNPSNTLLKLYQTLSTLAITCTRPIINVRTRAPPL